MITQKKRCIFLSSPLPVLSNYPSRVYINKSLGRVAKEHSLFIPMIQIQKNIRDVDKVLSETGKGGIDFTIRPPTTSEKEYAQKGSGSVQSSVLEAMKHPVKVFKKMAKLPNQTRLKGLQCLELLFFIFYIMCSYFYSILEFGHFCVCWYIFL